MGKGLHALGRPMSQYLVQGLLVHKVAPQTRGQEQQSKQTMLGMCLYTGFGSAVRL